MIAKHSVLTHSYCSFRDAQTAVVYCDRYIEIDISLTCRTTGFDIFLGNGKSRSKKKKKKQDKTLIQMKSSVNSRL